MSLWTTLTWRSAWTFALFACDNIVLCAGQVPHRDLADALKAAGRERVHVIGGAFEAGELDAKRAIDQAARLVASLP